MAKRPNILLILNDDMGYSDIGCYGGEVETPHLDKLAANGLRFSQFYNTARCSPSRASLLTGLHPHQTGIGILTYDSGPEGYAGNLNQRCATIAEVLKPAGYRSYLSGKWHVSSNLTQPTDSWPMQRGFDDFYGTIIGAGSFYDPNTLTRRNANGRCYAQAKPPSSKKKEPIPMGTRLAAVDLGSNSFRLEIGRVEHGAFQRTEYLKETVRQGGGLDEDRNLTATAMQNGWVAFNRLN